MDWNSMARREGYATVRAVLCRLCLGVVLAGLVSGTATAQSPVFYAVGTSEWEPGLFGQSGKIYRLDDHTGELIEEVKLPFHLVSLIREP
jgi:hypothetical protein